MSTCDITRPSMSAPVHNSATEEIVTLGDVLRHLEAETALEPRLCREMCSALRTVCRVLGKDATAVPAQPRQLRGDLAKVTPAMAGVSPGRWANIRSLTLKALKRVGIKSMPGRARAAHAPAWEALCASLPDRRCRSGLTRFMSYCT